MMQVTTPAGKVGKPERIRMLIRILLVLLILAAGTAVTVHTYYNATESESVRAITLTQTAMLSLPEDHVKNICTLPGNTENPDYLEIKGLLKHAVKIDQGVRFAYILFHYGGKIYFAVDSEPVNSKDYSPPGQEFTEADPDSRRAFSSANPIVSPPTTDRWGTWVSVLVPMKNDAGATYAVLGMDYPAATWAAAVAGRVVYSAATTLCLLALLLLFFHVLEKNRALQREQRKLSQMQQTLESFLDITPDLLCMVDGDGRFLRVNQAWEDFLGKSEAGILATNFWEYLHPDDVEKTQRFLTNGRPEAKCFVNRYRAADGTWRHFEWNSRFIGSVHYGSARDITDRIRAEEDAALEVRRQEALLQLQQMPGASLMDIAAFVMEQCVQLTRSSIGYIAQMSEDEAELDMLAWSQSAMAECGMPVKPLHYKLSATGLWGECIRQRKPVVTNDYDAPNPWKRGLPEGHVKLKRHMNIPIFDGDRIVLVAGVGNKETEYNDGDIRQITLLVTAMWRTARRKQDDEALRDAHRFTRQILSSVNEGISVFDRDQRYVLWNRFMEKLSGVPAADVLGRRATEAFPFLAGTATEKRLQDALNGSPSDPVEFSFNLEANGTSGWVSETSTPLYDEEGNITGAISTTHDITRRKEAEFELSRQRALTEAFYNTVHGILYLYDENSRLVQWNKAHETLTGYSAEELYGKDLMDWYKDDPESLQAVQKGLQMTLETGFGEAQARLQRKDGSRVPMYFTAKPLVMDDRQYFAGMGLDVSALVEAQDALRHSQERLRITLLSVGDGFISTDRDGHVEYLNKVAERLTGWTQKKARGRPLAEVFRIVDESTGKACESPVDRVLQTGGTVELGNHTVLLSRDGSARPVEDSAAPILDADGAIHGVVLVFRDFTEKKEKQARIEYLSYHDALTGLYNRRFYEEEFRRLNTGRNLPISIIMGDVNGLKLVNDAFGHEQGDRLLMKAARAIEDACRAEDIVARWGGDEFVILLPNTKRADAEAIVRRIETTVAADARAGITFSISFGWDTKETPEQDIVQVLKAAEDNMYRNKTLQSESVRAGAIHTIIRTLHEKSPREEGHSARTGTLCREIGNAMGLSGVRLKRLETAGLLHDIGKIAIREEILNKPGSLTEPEWEEMKRHPEIGFRILSSSYEMTELGEYVLMHHERPDGRGYPRGLSGEAIPLEARIIALADSFDAMYSDRSYKTMLELDECIAEIQRNAGTQFDPEVARVLVEKVLDSEWPKELPMDQAGPREERART